MGTLILPNTIDPLTTADAAEVEQNYQVMRAFINNDVVHRDGTKSMTGPLILANSNPADDLHAASRGYVDAFLPIGVVLPYAGAAAPAGGKWMLCQGQDVSTTAYPELFAVLQFRYGGSAGTFKLPDLQGRIPIGQTLGSLGGRFNTTGKSGGSWLVPVPSHTHTINHDHGSFNSANEAGQLHQHAITHDHPAFNTGADGGHAHMGSYQNNAETTGASTRFISYSAGGSHATITDTEADHTHTVNVPTFTGNSQSQNAYHTHPINVPNFTGTSGAYSKEVQLDDDPVTKTTTEHVPPYVVLQYIIRVQ